MAKQPTLPFLISVEDYHEFSYVQNVMKLLNPKVKVEELEMIYDYDEKENEDIPIYSNYVGLVYEGRKPNQKQIEEMFRTAVNKNKIYSVNCND